jgi:phosphatidate cytidylyltransferase
LSRGPFSDLGRRVATAAVALPLLLAGLLLGPPILAVAIVAAAVLLGASELFTLLAKGGMAPLRATGFVVMAVVFVDVARPGGLPGSAWPLAAVGVLLSMLLRSRDLALAVPSGAGTLLAAAYLGGLGGSIAALRILEPAGEGAWRMLLLLAIVMGADTAAFFVGSALGRRKLAPAISPGKTVEGLVGGLVGGILGALAVRWAGLRSLPIDHAVGLGLAAAALGTAGDLAESLVKRWAGVKDSGALFPGHGGMLDRLDSLLFAAPVLYYYFVFFAR